MLRQIIGKPPCYDLIVERIGRPQLNAVFTYGDVIYCLSKVHIDPGLMAHEEVHAKQQQQQGPEAWWEQFTKDRAFRLEQEVAAYRRQYLVYRMGLSRKEHRELLRKLSKDLSGPLYGRLLTRSAAEARIR